MGIFDFLKSDEEKEHDEATKILKKIAERKKTRTEAADEAISSKGNNNHVINGQISTGIGRFGLDKTNPIPVKGFTGLDYYFEKLCGPKRFSWDRRGSTSVENINGYIDIYSLCNINGEDIGTLYVCLYCDETSTRIPDVF